MTYDGRKFTGPNPIVGPNEELSSNIQQTESTFLNNSGLPENDKSAISQRTGVGLKKVQANRGAPTPYFPIPTEFDYKKGYIMRSFIKKVNDHAKRNLKQGQAQQPGQRKVGAGSVCKRQESGA